MALASPRSGASSQASFHTALESEASASTSASSPAQRRPCPYRKAKRLPRELKEHTQIFLEEQLCKHSIPYLAYASHVLTIPRRAGIAALEQHPHSRQLTSLSTDQTRRHPSPEPSRPPNNSPRSSLANDAAVQARSGRCRGLCSHIPA